VRENRFRSGIGIIIMLRLLRLALLVGGASALHVPAAVVDFRHRFQLSHAAASPQMKTSDEEVSDFGLASRWMSLQAAVDLSVVGIFAAANHFSFEEALAARELKFLIIMPAFTVFGQILRRFWVAEFEVKNFDDDPIVKFLGGPEKVRAVRDRWVEALTVRKAR
jgi:hypothetical protein